MNLIDTIRDMSREDVDHLLACAIARIALMRCTEPRYELRRLEEGFSNVEYDRIVAQTPELAEGES